MNLITVLKFFRNYFIRKDTCSTKCNKCRSLSINSGQATIVPFNLKASAGEVLQILSAIEKPMKFLGSELAEDNSPNAIFAKIYSKLERKLENINKSTL